MIQLTAEEAELIYDSLDYYSGQVDLWFPPDEVQGKHKAIKDIQKKLNLSGLIK